MPTLQELLLSLIEHDRWQDAVLAAGNIFFCFTLVPMLRHPVRPPLLTCIPTGVALLIGGFVFATLHLWLTALTQTISGLQWLALACKKPHLSVSQAGTHLSGMTINAVKDINLKLARLLGKPN
jgi:hypothetical protein